MNIGIILAAGQGWRLGAGTKKAFVKVLGKPLIYFSVAAFLDSEDIETIVVVVPKGSIKEFDEFAEEIEMNKKLIRITGADSRFGSLKKAINELDKHFSKRQLSNAKIIIHNAANPLVTLGEIKRVTETLEKYDAAGVGVPLQDTIRRVSRTKTETLERENIWRMQTPQGLKYKILMEGIKAAKGSPTDDIQLAEIIGIKPKLIPGVAQNFKVTTQTDLDLLEDVLLSRREYSAGLGEDSHPFGEEGKLILGGLTIAKHHKMQADSDGDVMIHSLITAILQGLGLGSLGPFAEPMLQEGITDSREYLARILDMLDDENWEIDGIEFVFECLEPKIDPIASKLKKSIAKLCGIEEEKVSIAAHTGDGLTAFARGEGIRCQCLVTLARIWLD
ncbi:2-C-methyl-D-erythritol 2,4-cyclodiphosphate synthase [Candidatus Peregrinibacteria bacterium CG22_combo_CG10-13_8_21_14_all_44_10]|nr:MAG: 2-C-methyl-D-erythritol 2,4-cyclodiphosphate synthase [Candidatus Peregrinibacteria bacterium CG2_30_44_17]PIP65998.1 MAG: 2-C-methyl-D-erythritol 2,4-cyclodiphosphate synthase [Candidatus Peregrinibacteria bacterium CG22_combo_CG10-13_8_21_14_all_44_10]